MGLWKAGLGPGRIGWCLRRLGWGLRVSGLDLERLIRELGGEIAKQWSYTAPHHEIG